MSRESRVESPGAGADFRRLTPHGNDVRILQVSDLHFGKPSIPEQVAALEEVIRSEHFDAIIIAGDLSQRTRTREFERARDFVKLCDSRAPTLVVPGNHDVAWWTAPFGVGSFDAMYSRYRALIREKLEDVVRIPGATIVGLNSSQGIQPYTLTFRARDLSVVGAVRHDQWAWAHEQFAVSPATDLRILVIHHNVAKGRHSRRWGLASRAGGLAHAEATGAHVVVCGHDHEEQIAEVSMNGRRFVVSTSNTLTDRTRGGRPGSWNVLHADAQHVCVELFEWRAASRDFARTRRSCYSRAELKAK